MYRTTGMVALTLATVLLLGGCARLAPRQPTPPAEGARERALAALTGFELRGRVAIRTATEGYSATLHWIQDDPRYTVRLSGPLGGGATTLAGDADGVELTVAGQPPVRATDPESLMQAMLGYRLPLAGLRYWALGLADPRLTVETLRSDADGRVLGLGQGGWEVQYDEYTAVAGIDGFDLPRRMELRNGDLRVRVVVTQWSLE